MISWRSQKGKQMEEENQEYFVWQESAKISFNDVLDAEVRLGKEWYEARVTYKFFAADMQKAKQRCEEIARKMELL